MKLSVIILNYNVRFFLELCIKSVEAALRDLDSEIIVIDNNSNDASCQMVKSLFPNVVLIENKENVGFAKANNQAVQKAAGEYICILNPDTVVAESSFKTLLDFADKQNNLGALGCRLIDGNGHFLPESKRNMPIVKIAAQKILGKTEHYYANHINQHGVEKVEVLVGAFMIMKRSIYEDVGGFDEDYFMYGEDIDLSYKLLKAGFENYYFGKQTTIHFKGESTLKDAIYAKRFYKAMRIFYRKHFKKSWIFNVLVGLATHLMSKRNMELVEKEHVVNTYEIISNIKQPKLENVFKTNYHYAKSLTYYKDRTEYILDGNYLSFSQIIEYITQKPENKEVAFKILPKNSNFILGSNSSKTQGAIIQF